MTAAVEMLKAFWRVPLIAVLAGLVAYGSSYLVDPTYEASTRLLLRGRDSTLLSTTGQGLSQQTGILDSALAAALSETQTALLGTRTIAEQVVDEMALDQHLPPPSLGSKLRALVNRGKAYLVHGFYAVPDPRSRAIEAVHGGLRAGQVDDSYVIELRAQASHGELAAAIANTAADVLVEVSKERFRSEAQAHRDFLGSQLDRAAAEADAALSAVGAFKEEHGITDLGLEQQLDATAAEELQAELVRARVALRSSQAELASLERALADVAPTDSTVSEIETGRSTTAIEATSASAVYQDLLTQKERMAATVEGTRATISALEEVLVPGAAGAGQGEEEAVLRRLEGEYEAASATYATISRDYQQAVLNAEIDRVEISRVETAAAPRYPLGPLRYLYLALGGLLGAAAGLVLTMLIARRQGWRPFELFGGGDDRIVLPDEELPLPASGARSSPDPRPVPVATSSIEP